MHSRPRAKRAFIDCKENFSVCELEEMSECIINVCALKLIRKNDRNLSLRARLYTEVIVQTLNNIKQRKLLGILHKYTSKKVHIGLVEVRGPWSGGKPTDKLRLSKENICAVR